jgi:hypothetical protein
MTGAQGQEEVAADFNGRAVAPINFSERDRDYSPT